MSSMEYFNIGKLVAQHGLKGELLLKHTLGKKKSLKNLPAIFIEEKKNSFLPWFIESSKIKTDDEVYLKLEGINTREAAMKLVKKTSTIEFSKVSPNEGFTISKHAVCVIFFPQS